MNYSVMILAAGKGSRTGLEFNKVLYPLENGKTVLDCSLQLFRRDGDCTQIIVVCAPYELEQFREKFAGAKTEFVCGGDTRQKSAASGLNHVREEVVLVHDGARPFVSQEAVNRLKEALKKEKAAILAIPVVDTIKRIDENGHVLETPVRSSLLQAQTPQGFQTALLKAVNQRAIENDFTGTDDASLVEVFSEIPVFCVPGEAGNIKITRPEDLPKRENK